MTKHNYIKKNQKLPEQVYAAFETISNNAERDLLIKALAEANWTYEAISNASGITRERVRQITNNSTATAKDLDPRQLPVEIPEPPIKLEREKREYNEPSPETLARLLELQPYAQMVRANGKKYREEGEEFTRLINKAHKEENVPVYRIAKRLGVTNGAIRSRLVRYGYLEAKTGTSKVYKPISEKNRLVG
jgi:transcriptional regulator with GAF, ATPase, and Fis domain